MIDMAKPIEPTPILHGEDAKGLLHEVAHPKYSKAKEKFLVKCKATYKKYAHKCPDCVEKDKQIKKLLWWRENAIKTISEKNKQIEYLRLIGDKNRKEFLRLFKEMNEWKFECSDLKAKMAKAYDKVDEMAIDTAAWSEPYPKEWGTIYEVPELAFKEMKKALRGVKHVQEM